VEHKISSKGLKKDREQKELIKKREERRKFIEQLNELMRVIQ
jgi:hypothetical protein